MSASLVGSEMCIRDSAGSVSGSEHSLRIGWKRFCSGHSLRMCWKRFCSCLLYTSDAADDM
eukprot:10503925-Alexandrium_andersonii.AAC.1